jgi:hypothetical protein
MFSTLEDAFNTLTDAVQVISKQHAPPLPPHAPTPVSQSIKAVGRFLDHIKRCKENNDEWLSGDQVIQVLNIFRGDEKISEHYLQVLEFAEEGVMRLWVLNELKQLT